MIWTLLLLPLALARPHLPDSIAHRRQARALVDRAGAAYDNETQAEYNAWEQEHLSHTAVISQSAVSTASAAASASAAANTDTTVNTNTGIQAVGSALTAVSTPSPTASSAVETSSQEQAPAQSSAAVVVSSEETDPATSAAPVDAIASPSPSAEESSATLSSSSAARVTKVVTASRSSTVVQVTASSSATAAAAKADSGDDKIAGINKTTFIIIIVVASVIALAGVGWTVFRRWKLRPSRRFDERMRPIDFSPHQDVFAEKTHHRSASNSSAALQRDEFVAELDNKHVAGIPDHDFTAGSGMAGQGIYHDNHHEYHTDPYAHAEEYEYDPTYPYDQHQHSQAQAYDQPTQDTSAGYAELQRGNSIGSGSGHGHGAQYPVEQFTMPMPDQYLGRPTGGADGPYSQAAHHRY